MCIPHPPDSRAVFTAPWGQQGLLLFCLPRRQGLCPRFRLALCLFCRSACRRLRNDNLILKKIFSNAICSLYMKSNEQNGCSCLLNEPCGATLVCFPTRVILKAALGPFLRTLEASGALKRQESEAAGSVHPLMMLVGLGGCQSWDREDTSKTRR